MRQRLERRHNQRIPRQHCQSLTVRCKYRGSAAPRQRIVETRKIIMHQ
jgi:hypothetical protein